MQRQCNHQLLTDIFSVLWWYALSQFALSQPIQAGHFLHQSNTGKMPNVLNKLSIFWLPAHLCIRCSMFRVWRCNQINIAFKKSMPVSSHSKHCSAQFNRVNQWAARHIFNYIRLPGFNQFPPCYFNQINILFSGFPKLHGSHAISLTRRACVYHIVFVKMCL